MGIRGGLVSFGEPRLVAEIHTAARRARPAIYEPRALGCANVFGCVVAISHLALETEDICWLLTGYWPRTRSEKRWPCAVAI